VIEYVGHFLKRDYPLHLLEEAALKARRLIRKDIINPTTPSKDAEPIKTKDPTNILVTQFHPQDNALRDIVMNNWDILGKSLNTQPLLKNKPMIGYRRPPNLKDILTKAEIRTKKEIATDKLISSSKWKASNLTFPQKIVKTENLSQTKIDYFFKSTEVSTSPCDYSGTEQNK
jgi:hypothetical protein